MLKQLRIQNLILIEKADIPFHEGFHILSGETGSGKSALLSALELIGGERADTAQIRRGCDKATVEAVFETVITPALAEIFHETGLDHEEGEPIILRREISESGKSRAFINHQPVQIGLLKRVGSELFDIVGQHASRLLLSSENQRQLLDTFGELTADATAFRKCWIKQNSLQEELHALAHSESERMREAEACRREVEEIDEAHLKECEEEELFAEYTLLSNSEELSEKSSSLVSFLTGDRGGFLPQLARQSSNLDALSKLDPALNDTANSLRSTLIELQEIARTISHYQTRLEQQPDRLAFVNERLSQINKLKRKYGSSISEVLKFAAARKERLGFLENADNRIEALKEQLNAISQENDKRAAQLTGKRAAAAKKLQKDLVGQLRKLNMAKADFEIEISPQKRTGSGDDHIEFYLIPNAGEHRVAVKECASGGELSRLLLSLQVLLAGKESIPTLVFDEIDANIGGATANVVGELLQKISRQHQVLCVTHFPQVAKHAEHHYEISKEESKGRTSTLIRLLNTNEREAELGRMAGITG